MSSMSLILNKYSLLFLGFFQVNSWGCEEISRTITVGTYLNLLSEQYEYFPNGTQILKESGVLPGGIITGSIICDKLIISGEISKSSGIRDYVGISSNGSSLSTTSKIKQDVTSIGIGWRVINNFAILADTTIFSINRDIQSTSNAQGYPEYYKKNFTRLGAQWSISAFDSHWSASALRSIYGRQYESVKLPGKDAVELSFEEPRQWEINLNYKKYISKSTFAQIQYKYIKTLTAQSRVSVLTSGGNPVGVVSQPKTFNVDQPLILTIGVLF